MRTETENDRSRTASEEFVEHASKKRQRTDLAVRDQGDVVLDPTTIEGEVVGEVNLQKGLIELPQIEEPEIVDAEVKELGKAKRRKLRSRSDNALNKAVRKATDWWW